MKAQVKENTFRPFSPTYEAVDTSGLFGAFCGVSGKETGDSLSMVEGEPAFQLRSREHIVGEFTAMTCALVMVDFLHYPWLSYGNSLYARKAKNPHGQPGVFGGVASTDDGSALTIGLTARPRTRHSNDPVKCSGGQVARQDITSTTPSSPDSGTE